MEPDNSKPRSTRRRGRSRRQSSIPVKVGLGLFAATVVLAPELLGGAYGWAITIIAGLSGLTALLIGWTRRKADTRAGGSAALLAAVVLALVWTGLQAAPLPCGWVEVIAPESARQAQLAAEALEEATPVLCSASRDPGATRGEIVKGFGMVSILLAAWLLTKAGHRRDVLLAVAASVVCMAIVALAHAAAAATRVFGLYEPVFVEPRLVLAPLMNENHLGGFLAMGVPLLLGLGLSQRTRGPRWLILLGASIVISTVFLSLSRGAVGAMVGGVGLFVAGLLATSSRTRVRRPRAVLAGGATLAAGLGLAAYLAAGPFVKELEAGSLAKLGAVAPGLSFSMIEPWIGVGRGGFSAAFVETFGTTLRIEHPENLLVQWTSEWGIPVTLLLLAGVLYSLSRCMLNAKSVSTMGAAVAVITVGVHDLVDFSLELAGVATCAAALLGVVAASDRTSPRERPTVGGLPVSRVALAVGTLSVVAALGLGARLDATSTFALQRELTASLSSGNREVFRETLRRGLELHPGEPAFSLLAGAEAARNSDLNAPRWLSRAMAQAPGWAAPHTETARWLWALGRRDQAMLEIREAAALDPREAVPLTCALLRESPDPVLALRSVPRGATRGEFQDHLAACLGLASPVGVALDEQLASESPALASPRVRQTKRLLRAHSTEDALRTIVPVAEREPNNSSVQEAYGQALLAAGRATEAMTAMREAESRVENPPAVLRVRARAAAAAGDTESMRSAIEELRALALASPSEVASTLRLQGRLEKSLGNNFAALHAFEEAYRIRPDPASLREAAALAERLGDRRRAYHAYSILCETANEPLVDCANRNRVEAQHPE